MENCTIRADGEWNTRRMCTQMGAIDMYQPVLLQAPDQQLRINATIDQTGTGLRKHADWILRQMQLQHHGYEDVLRNEIKRLNENQK